MADQVRTGDVFVPGRNPRYTYNPRTDRELEARLRTYLDDGGAILTLVGPTKTGKTVLLRRVIEDPVWIEAQGISDADTFWSLVGNEVGLYLDAGRNAEQGSTRTGSGQIGFGSVANFGGQLSSTSGTSDSSTAVRVTAAEARKALQESGRVLVVDDFHFIERGVQQQIVRAVKPLVFNDTRVVFAAISHRVHDVPGAVEDMVGRSDPLRIDLWKKDELLVIARQGFAALGVLDIGGALADRLATASYGSPHLMQKLCRELVRDVNGVAESLPEAIDLHEPQDWTEFFSAQIEDYAGQWFTRLLSGPKIRGSKRTTFVLSNGREVDGYGLILLAVASTGPQLSISRQTLNDAITGLLGEGQQPEAHQVTRFLKHMTRIAARNLEEEVLPEEVLDDDDVASTYVYSGAEPVLEYVEDGPASVLNIADPFFAYYIRWGSDTHIGE